MPSDCQCSNACDCSTEYVTKVLNNKKATELIKKLEKEVAKLKAENYLLSSELKKATRSKKSIKEELKRKLDNL